MKKGCGCLIFLLITFIVLFALFRGVLVTPSKEASAPQPEQIEIAPTEEIIAPEEPKETEEELLARIAAGVPYVGMDSKYIDMTSLGVHSKTGTNYKKVQQNGYTTRHACTLYYWIDGSSCLFIARVQDDIHEVIHVEERPSGSFFGNP